MPYKMSQPFMDFLENAVGVCGESDEKKTGWHTGGSDDGCSSGIQVHNRVYDEVGHTFSDGMMRDSIEFLMQVIEKGPLPKTAKL